MGGADMVCSDKTGTLTQNKMQITKFWNDDFLDVELYNDHLQLSSYVQDENVQEIFA